MTAKTITTPTADTIPTPEKTIQQMTGSEIIIKSLVDCGVDTIFGYPGGAVLPIYDALFQQNHVRHILVRHEQAAAHAAEGYARSTGKPGVILVTSGPGATNTVTGLADAMLDSIPLVCITGQVPSHLIGSDAFQEADTTGITRACTKHNYLVQHIGDLPEIVHEAFHVATHGRPGPVVIDVPKDILNTTGEYDHAHSFKRHRYEPKTIGNQTRVEQAVKLMANAKKPLLYVGGGVINSGMEACEELHKLVKETGFPITLTFMGLGAYPGTDEQFLQMPGMHGSLEANMAMHDCDVLVCIGARFDDRVTGKLSGFSPDSVKIHVDIDASSINKNVLVDIPIVGDAGTVMRQMRDIWRAKKYQPDAASLKSWWKQIELWRARKSYSYKQTGDIIKPQYALDRLYEITKDKAPYITTDVGQHQMWAAQYIKYNKPYHWMSSGGLGTMGYGMPSAMGVQIAHPDELVMCVTGEASLMMNIQELSTIKQYRLPIKIFILNNRYMGMVRQWQQMFHGERYSESYMDSLPDFVKLAEAYGIKALRCDDPKKVDATIEEMLTIDGPVLVDMMVDQNENVYPMIPAGAAHNELLLGPDEPWGDLDKSQV